MLSLEDPLTGDFPTRYTVEEDEQLAVDLVKQYVKVPDIKVCDGWLDSGVLRRPLPATQFVGTLFVLQGLF